MSRTLITGYALNVVEGKLTGPNPQNTHALAVAKDSLKKLSHCDIKSVICYHGGVIREDANRWISELANALECLCHSPRFSVVSSRGLLAKERM